MECKYCNSIMNCVDDLGKNKIKIYKCKCKASCIIDMKSNDVLWHDGKPPRVECTESFMDFKKGEIYRIVDADTYQVMVEINNGTEWIDKDNSRFKIFM